MESSDTEEEVEPIVLPPDSAAHTDASFFEALGSVSAFFPCFF